MTEPEDAQTTQDVYERLRKAAPEEKRAIVLRLIKAHPGNRLELPARDGEGANLERADLHELDLRRADLRGAYLGYADLKGAHLEAADLRGAKLWAASLEGANLLSANLRDATLWQASLPGANLWAANLQDAFLSSANLQDADLRRATLWGADLSCANLQDADLAEAKLERVDLSVADITHIKIAGAWLDRTRLKREQLGGAIGEEVARSHGDARQGYLGLKQNFDDLGDYDAASWAYRRERCMEKWKAWWDAWEAFFTLKWRLAVKCYAKVAGDWAVETLCDYGESVWRVLGWMAALLLVIGPGLIWLVGGLVWTEHPYNAYFNMPSLWQRQLYAGEQYLLYALDTFTTAKFSELEPASDLVRLVSGLMGLIGIFLTGLLGFVAANRIRHS